MASASPAVDRIDREHRDRSGETFERFAGGTATHAEPPLTGRTSVNGSGRRSRPHHRPAGGHGHAP